MRRTGSDPKQRLAGLDGVHDALAASVWAAGWGSAWRSRRAAAWAASPRGSSSRQRAGRGRLGCGVGSGSAAVGSSATSSASATACAVGSASAGVGSCNCNCDRSGMAGISSAAAFVALGRRRGAARRRRATRGRPAGHAGCARLGRHDRPEGGGSGSVAVHAARAAEKWTASGAFRERERPCCRGRPAHDLQPAVPFVDERDAQRDGGQKDRRPDGHGQQAAIASRQVICFERGARRSLSVW